MSNESIVIYVKIAIVQKPFDIYNSIASSSGHQAGWRLMGDAVFMPSASSHMYWRSEQRHICLVRPDGHVRYQASTANTGTHRPQEEVV